MQRINLIDQIYTTRKLKLTFNRVLIGTAIFCIGLFSSNIIDAVQTEVLEKEVAILQKNELELIAKNNEWKKKSDSVSEVTLTKDEKERKRLGEFINEYVNSWRGNQMHEHLERLSMSTTKGAWVTEIYINTDDKEVYIKGNSVTTEDALNFLNNIRKNKVINEKLVMNKMEKDKDTHLIAFTISTEES